MPKWRSRADEIQWHIFLASLNPAKGSEQSGRRPVLVISRESINEILPVVNVIPLTSCKSAARSIYPNEVLLPADVAGLQTDSIALCYQIRTLDKIRLEKDVSELIDTKLRQEIVEALRFQLCI
jgi:mRNA interferase MazF